MIAETRARIEANKAAAGLKLVAGAASFSALGPGRPPLAAPAAYVIHLASRAAENEMGSDVIQRVEHQVGVVLAVRGVADAAGAAASDEVEDVADAVIGLLLGWSPGEGWAPFEFRGAETISFADAHVWNRLVFVTSRYIRN